MRYGVILGGGGGADVSVVTASDAQVLTGYTIVDADGNPISGSMANNGAVVKTLNCSGVYTIAKGYHDGNGKITANSLASQTSATATAAKLLKGETAWVNGVKLTGTVEVSSIPSFSIAAYSTSQLTFTWKNPAQASGRPFSGVIICCKTGSYPTGPTDGFKYMGTGSNSAASGTSSVTLSGFTAGTTYYCRIWAYCVCSVGTTVNSTKVLVSSSYMSATGKPTANGRKAFTASGKWTVPSGVRSINIHCTGGGGAGYYTKSSYSNNAAAGGGGGGGYTAYKKNIAVTPGQVITVVVGAGSTSTTLGSLEAGCGGTSSASLGDSVLVSAAGGQNARETGDSSTSSSSYRRVGGFGGSAGGKGGVTGDSEDDGSAGGNGASNGGSIDCGKYGTSLGQGTTTYEFGDSSKTLYAGGGGGGGGYWSWVEHPGYGGSGGGGNGGHSSTYDIPANGSAGTGGGGGGGLVKAYGTGGSGNVIITW